jgi:hypothetical protein
VKIFSVITESFDNREILKRLNIPTLKTQGANKFFVVYLKEKSRFILIDDNFKRITSGSVRTFYSTNNPMGAYILYGVGRVNLNGKRSNQGFSFCLAEQK